MDIPAEPNNSNNLGGVYVYEGQNERLVLDPYPAMTRRLNYSGKKQEPIDPKILDRVNKTVRSKS
jgi:hypothetical protein